MVANWEREGSARRGLGNSHETELGHTELAEAITHLGNEGRSCTFTEEEPEAQRD